MLAFLRAHWFGLALFFTVLTYSTAEGPVPDEVLPWVMLDLFLFWRVSKGARWAYEVLMFLQLTGALFAGFFVVASRFSSSVSTDSTSWTVLCASASVFCLLLRGSAADEREAVRGYAVPSHAR